MHDKDTVKATEAMGIYSQITSLIVFRRILLCKKGLSDQLQSTHVNMAKAAELVISTLETLQSF